MTVLLNALHQELGWTTFHSPVISDKMFVRPEPEPLDFETFRKSLFTGEPLGTIKGYGMHTLVEGTARGPIVGGCLSLVASSIGTRYQVQTSGKILFLEDIDERPYRLDRMAIQLMHSGMLDGVKGIIFGQLPHCNPAAPEKDPSQTTAHQALRGALEPFLRAHSIPAVFDFPAGHGSPQITFSLGTEVELRALAANPEIEFYESGVN